MGEQATDETPFQFTSIEPHQQQDVSATKLNEGQQFNDIARNGQFRPAFTGFASFIALMGQWIRLFHVDSSRQPPTSLVLTGWNMAGSGPLLLNIQQHYSLGYTGISIIFVSSTSGLVLSSVFNYFYSARVGVDRASLDVYQECEYRRADETA